MKNRQSKTKKPADQKLEGQDFDMFEALKALDLKDYGWYDRLTPEQQKKFSPFMLLKWISVVKGSRDLQHFYVVSTNLMANMHYLNNEIAKNHPKLQWLMLCAASPGIGKQYRQWIPHIKESVSKLKDQATVKEIKEYYGKIYPTANAETLTEVAQEFVHQQRKKCRLAQIYPGMKLDDIEHLSTIVTDDDIARYEEEAGINDNSSL